MKDGGDVLFVLKIFVRVYDFPADHWFLYHRHMSLTPLWAIPHPHVVRVCGSAGNIQIVYVLYRPRNGSFPNRVLIVLVSLQFVALISTVVNCSVHKVHYVCGDNEFSTKILLLRYFFLCSDICLCFLFHKVWSKDLWRFFSRHIALII